MGDDTKNIILNYKKLSNLKFIIKKIYKEKEMKKIKMN